jgi:hypothetical protein
MRHSFHVLALALCAGLACAPLYAGTPINETRPLDPRGRISIDNLKGRIQVRAWDRNEVRVTGTLGDGVEKLVVRGDRDDLEVRVEYPKHMGGWRNDRTGPTELLLRCRCGRTWTSNRSRPTSTSTASRPRTWTSTRSAATS